MTVKSTYSLDPETVRLLGDLARRRGVSKSEVLRDAIRKAAAGEADAYPTAAQALGRLQGMVAADGVPLERWRAEAVAERKAASAKRGAKAR